MTGRRRHILFLIFWAMAVTHAQPVPLSYFAREKVYGSYDEAFEDSWNVVILDLAGQGLTFNAERVGRLENLRVLSLAGNPRLDMEEAFTKKYFGNLPYIQILDLQENNLRNLPSGINRFGNLTILYAGKNQLGEIPQFVCNLGFLEVLSFHHNRLREIPECLGNLDSLHTLDLSGIPNSIPRFCSTG